MPAQLLKENSYRQILGVRFFVGDAPDAVGIGSRGGLTVVPAAPALMDLTRDREYRRALLESDLAITDSGFLVLLWNALKLDRINRVSGLEYLRLLLALPELRDKGSVFWVMPSTASMDQNLKWLQSQGFPFSESDCYVAPKYDARSITDSPLAKLIDERQPKHIIIGLGGGVQEKLGLYLKNNCKTKPAIHCIGAAIGFLTGDQVKIPHWADKMILGWLFRCVSNPGKFVPRYAKALQLPVMLLRNHERLPAMISESPVR